MWIALVSTDERWLMCVQSPQSMCSLGQAYSIMWFSAWSILSENGMKRKAQAVLWYVFVSYLLVKVQSWLIFGFLLKFVPENVNVNDRFNIWNHRRSQFRPMGPTFTSLSSATPHGLLMLRNCLIDFAVEHWFGCRATEPGFTRNIGDIEVWLIDWLIEMKQVW